LARCELHAEREHEQRNEDGADHDAAAWGVMLLIVELCRAFGESRNAHT
jgi:hypothetical protein